MADYWKSQPRKFCEFCKCWIADNKASRDFHEKGKRHQENVKKKIDELRKKGVKDAEKEAEMTDSLMAMEKAAMAALKKDLADNPAMASQYGIKTKTEEKESSDGAATQSDTASGSETATVDINPEYWHEATNQDGYVYYWSSTTGESVWEKPKGFIGEADRVDQMATSPETPQGPNTSTSATKEAVPKSAKVKPAREAIKKVKSSKVKPAQATVSRPIGTRDGSTAGVNVTGPEVKDTGPEFKATFGPQKRTTAYGHWEQIPEEKVEEDEVDLELPVTESHATEEVKVIKIAEPKIKFREKKVDTLGADFVAFKKRKLAGGQRKLKKREDDG